jgi:hypothetical protein
MEQGDPPPLLHPCIIALYGNGLWWTMGNIPRAVTGVRHLATAAVIELMLPAAAVGN